MLTPFKPVSDGQEPFQALEVRKRTFHVILDVQKQPLDEADFDVIPHEVYRVRRNLDEDL